MKAWAILLISQAKFLWVCTCVPVGGCLRVIKLVHALAGARSQYWVSYTTTLHLIVWDRVSYWMWSSPFWLTWLVCKPLWTAYLSVSSGLESQVCTRVPGFLHTCGKSESPCLPNKHLPLWAISTVGISSLGNLMEAKWGNLGDKAGEEIPEVNVNVKHSNLHQFRKP